MNYTVSRKSMVIRWIASLTVILMFSCVGGGVKPAPKPSIPAENLLNGNAISTVVMNNRNKQQTMDTNMKLVYKGIPVTRNIASRTILTDGNTSSLLISSDCTYDSIMTITSDGNVGKYRFNTENIQVIGAKSKAGMASDSSENSVRWAGVLEVDGKKVNGVDELRYSPNISKHRFEYMILGKKISGTITLTSNAMGFMQNEYDFIYGDTVIKGTSSMSLDRYLTGVATVIKYDLKFGNRLVAGESRMIVELIKQGLLNVVGDETKTKMTTTYEFNAENLSEDELFILILFILV